MATKNYHWMNGNVVGESGPSGRTDYLTDALSSVVATVSDKPEVVNTYRYKPYGSSLSESVIAASPSYLWKGAEGYRNTGTHFVLSNHYSNGIYLTISGGWLSLGIDSSNGSSYTLNGGQTQQIPICGQDAPFTWGNLQLTEVHIDSYLYSDKPCDSFSFETTWKLPSPITTGAVIQKIYMEFDHRSCIDEKCGGSGQARYIEAWNINNGVIEYGGLDYFFWTRPNSWNCLCPRGTASTIGQVGVVNGCNAGARIWTKGTGGKKSWEPWGTLWHITPIPSGFRPGPSRKAVENYDYNCCVENPGYTAVIEYYPILKVNKSLGSGYSGSLKQECRSETCS